MALLEANLLFRLHEGLLSSWYKKKNFLFLILTWIVWRQLFSFGWVLGVWLYSVCLLLSHWTGSASASLSVFWDLTHFSLSAPPREKGGMKAIPIIPIIPIASPPCPAFFPFFFFLGYLNNLNNYLNGYLNNQEQFYRVSWYETHRKR